MSTLLGKTLSVSMPFIFHNELWQHTQIDTDVALSMKKVKIYVGEGYCGPEI
jgi:hypothetical protein